MIICFMTLDNALEKYNYNFGFSVFFKEATLTLKRNKIIIAEIILSFKNKTNYQRCNTTM